MRSKPDVTGAVFCDDLQLIKKYNCTFDNKEIYVITDSYTVKRYVEDETNYKCLFIDGCETLDYQSTDAIIKNLNHVIEACDLNNPSYVYEFTNRVEGTMAEQICRFIYLLRCFEEMLDDIDIDIFFLASNNNSAYYAVKCYARNKKIKGYMLDKKYCFGLTEFYRKLGAAWVALSFVVKELRIKRKILKCDDITRDIELGILFTNGKIRNRVAYIDIAKEYFNGISSCFVCEESHDAAKYFIENGFHAIELEQYFSLRKAIKSYISSTLDNKKLIRAIKRDYKKSYCNYDISKEVAKQSSYELLYNSFRHSVYANMYSRLWTQHTFGLVIPDGDSTFISTIVAFNTHKSVTGKELVFFRDQMHPSIIEKLDMATYENKPNMIRHRTFLAGSPRLDYIRNNGWTGNVYYGKLFYWQLNKMKSAKISSKQDYTYVWAPSNNFLGFMPLWLLVEFNKSVIDLFINRSDKLYVKFHPLQDEILINEIKNDYIDNKNICFVDSKDDIHEVLNNADFVITTPSGVIYDAYTSCKPIMVLYGGEQIMGTLREPFASCFVIIDCSREKYRKEMQNVLFSRDRQKEWNSIIEMQSKYWDYYSGSKYNNMGEVIKEIIKERGDRDGASR